MHVLVTGGSGFIGSHIVDFHLNKGDKVHVIDDLSTGEYANLERYKDSPHFRFDQDDILTWNGLDRATAWADRIYHMAAVVGVYKVVTDPIKVLATNVPGCERVLRAASSGGWKPRIILASSSEVYGQLQKDAFEETDNIVVESAAQYRWNYAISKITDEAFGVSYARDVGLPITLIRFFNVIGPRQTGRYGMVVPRFVHQAVKGEEITVYGDGKQTRCFCDVRDAVASLDILADSSDTPGEIVNVGHDREISMNELAELIKARAKSSSPIVHVPYDEAYASENFVDIQRRKPSLDKFRQLTNYQHQWTLEETIDNLIELAKKNEFNITTDSDG